MELSSEKAGKISKENDPAEIVIWTDLSLRPGYFGTYAEALAYIDTFREKPNYAPSQDLVVHIRLWAGFSKIPLQDFTSKLNLDQIEYHVYW